MNCPACGAEGAYVGLQTVECSTLGCKHGPKRETLETGVLVDRDGMDSYIAELLAAKNGAPQLTAKQAVDKVMAEALARYMVNLRNPIDDGGRKHEHDPNEYLKTYSCTCGNERFHVRGWPKCWCGWTNDPRGADVATD